MDVSSSASSPLNLDRSDLEKVLSLLALAADRGAFQIAEFRDVGALWEKLNAAPAPAGITLPLALSDGSVADSFLDFISELQAAYVTEAGANQNAVLARSQRNEIMATAKAVMVSYRKVVPARCAQHPTLVDTLPAVTPPPLM